MKWRKKFIKNCRQRNHSIKSVNSLMAECECYENVWSHTIVRCEHILYVGAWVWQCALANYHSLGSFATSKKTNENIQKNCQLWHDIRDLVASNVFWQRIKNKQKLSPFDSIRLCLSTITAKLSSEILRLFNCVFGHYFHTRHSPFTYDTTNDQWWGLACLCRTRLHFYVGFYCFIPMRLWAEKNWWKT